MFWKRYRPLALMAALLLLPGCESLTVLYPAGDVAAQQSDLIIASTLLMLIIIVPVILLTLFFAWRYRASNKRATYAPEWSHSTGLEVIIWAAPLAIIIALGGITWVGTHVLDPYRPLGRIDAARPVEDGVLPLEVEVVSLDWKWLFIYPQQGIATVNELVAPVDVPINFRISSENNMNTLWVPTLAGMIYSMPGMETKLHAVINRAGVFEGRSGHYSGAGFSDMHFKFHGMNQTDFTAWVERVRAEGGGTLDRARYIELAKPSVADPVRYFGGFEDGLFRAIVERCVRPGTTCMSEMMHGAGGHGGPAAPNRQPSSSESSAPAATPADGHGGHGGHAPGSPPTSSGTTE
ncbi:ubiquinol oxidase subunit II [Pseudoroseomonas globiformis]|uniref:Ubiquinol oxidase subunit 2 n=1 Tax=Teichococcus globiformis TaxID=2307229 RepID=A0ABV7FV73_9PROT